MVNLFGPDDRLSNDFPEKRKEHDHLTAHDQNLDQVPAVEVIEVNDDAAWALWEDSVAFQDSQFSEEAAFASTLQTPLDQPEKPAEFIDPFASVHKKSR